MSKQETNTAAGQQGRWDFFFRRETNHRPWAEQVKRPASVVTVVLPHATTIEDAILAARAAGMPKGSSRSGCFEIQNDMGIWSSKTGGRINPKTASFKTWEQIEEEEE